VVDIVVKKGGGVHQICMDVDSHCMCLCMRLYLFDAVTKYNTIAIITTTHTKAISGCCVRYIRHFESVVESVVESVIINIYRLYNEGNIQTIDKRG
jgi:hypothetical protein